MGYVIACLCPCVSGQGRKQQRKRHVFSVFLASVHLSFDLFTILAPRHYLAPTYTPDASRWAAQLWSLVSQFLSRDASELPCIILFVSLSSFFCGLSVCIFSLCVVQIERKESQPKMKAQNMQPLFSLLGFLSLSAPPVIRSHTHTHHAGLFFFSLSLHV